MKKKDIIVLLLCLLISISFGVYSHDLIIGGTLLFTALLNSYLASNGKKITYLFGLINCLLYSYIGFKNSLYGLFFFYLFIFTPIQFIGYFNWGKNINNDNMVKIRGFTLKYSIIITLSCVLGSLILAFLLNLIPSQQLPVLDAASNIINVCANILMILRFKECWWIWIFNNLIDLGIWIFIFINNGPSSFMVLLVSIGYLLINIYGIVKWQKEDKKNRL